MLQVTAREKCNGNELNCSVDELTAMTCECKPDEW